MSRISPARTAGWIVTLATTLFVLPGAASDPIAWKSGESDVIIRYETSGGRVTWLGTSVPAWTLYGDGLVVWTDDAAEPTPGFATSVWTGRLAPTSIRRLLTLAAEGGFLELQRSYDPTIESDSRPMSGEIDVADPAPLPLDIETETLSISLASRKKQVSVRPAGWSGAPASFRSCREAVLSQQLTGSQRFVPQRYRLQVTPLAGKIAADYPLLPRALVDFGNTAAPQDLERKTGEALAALLKAAGTTVAQAGRVFSVELLAVPPRTP